MVNLPSRPAITGQWIAIELETESPVTATLALVLTPLGLVGGFLSGLLGIGGGVVVVPLLLYVPPLFGFPAFPVGHITGIAMGQVFASALIGMSAHRRAGHVNGTLVAVMGGAIVIGSFVGATLSSYLAGTVVQGVYAALAVLAAVMLLRPPPRAPQDDLRDFNKPLAAALALVVGVFSGIIGAGGAFILLPVMIGWFHIPVRLAVGSSLGIVLLSATAGFAGKVLTHQVPWLPTLFVVIGAIIGSQLGARLSAKVPVKELRWTLAGLIGLVAIKMIVELLG